MSLFEVGGKRAKIDLIPNECPRCKSKIEPREVVKHLITYPSDLLQIVYQCTYRHCTKLFISTFGIQTFDSYGPFLDFKYIKSEPNVPEKERFNEEIKRVSSTFERIYNQAVVAEAHGLTDICGAGYRKALEFLVKDYLIHTEPDQAENIKRQQLSQCINRIDDDNIKFCAERATWIGNDETHYTRKWEEQDLSDLKALIRLTINWMTNKLMMERYRGEMATGR